MSMTSTDAITKVLRTEGGFVNNPSDRGGATNYGITMATYSVFLGRQATLQEMIDMPKGNAILIYKKKYWDYVRGDQITSYPAAYVMFDQYANRGKYGIMQAQNVLGIYPDGKMSEELLKRINNSNPEKFITDFLNLAESNYKKIAQNDPTQVKFLNGWLNRVIDLRHYTNSLLTAVGELKEKTIATLQDNPWLYALPVLGMLGVMAYYQLATRKA